MDFYILAKSWVYVLLMIGHSTTLVFEDPIEFVSFNKMKSLDIQRMKNQKILVLNASDALSGEYLVVLTKNHQFQFRLKTVESHYHPLIYLREGKINSSYTLKQETENYRVLEGDTSLMVQTKKDKIMVNEMWVEKLEYFSKGAPIMINHQRVFN